MKHLFSVIVCVILVASCATSTSPLLPYDSSEFTKRPEVVTIKGKRFLAYQLGGELLSTQPGIRSKVVNDEVHCFADIFISANAMTDQPRLDRLPDKGEVFWLNPDGTIIKLYPKE